MIKIYYCNSLSDAIPEEISEYRMSKIISARHAGERQRMINAAKVLKAGFNDHGVAEKDVIYAFGDYGKPYAANHPHIHFSLTHSDNISLCAFYDTQIGIDCEKARRAISKEIIMRYFSELEQQDHSCDPLKLWVSKEAVTKYTGKGLASGRTEYEIPHFDQEIAFDGIYLKTIDIEGYITAICVSQKDSISITKLP